MQWVADRTAELGYPISRSRLSDLERGKRGGLLGLAELIVLAKALEVPPVSLLYPNLAQKVVEVTPQVEATAWNALKWFTGEEPLMDYRLIDGVVMEGIEPEAYAHFEANAQALELLRLHDRLASNYREDQQLADRAWERAGGATSPEVERIEERLDHLQAQIRGVRAHLREKGITVPYVVSPAINRSPLDDDSDEPY
ncbi:helix-turn-helix transcriptional regulator [Rhodococcus sp. HNM0569]|uniref:helix-turn-helix transcriptional regulator n=1 Tax=Rhodococcus sp. HNM0569 TaxID=2716340 RepID=UPI00146B28CA|nr:helix-turn-helix transcriptional regulator [Rhodococcus sp. HNM0569]NLU81619.1 helix-turn-helix transcriptional regulator [Rhodococcus sp. HNM0569]